MPFHALDPRPIITFSMSPKRNKFSEINSGLNHFINKTFLSLIHDSVTFKLVSNGGQHLALSLAFFWLLKAILKTTTILTKTKIYFVASNNGQG